MTQVKRFIAGAVCPRCGEMDRIVMYREGERQYRECVSCGFHDEIRLQTAPREVQTRVSGSADEAKPVRLIDPEDAGS